MSPTDGSTSRGTAMSMMNSGSRPAPAGDRLDVRARDDRPLRSGGGDDDVGGGRAPPSARPTAPRVRRPSAASASACAAVRLVMTISPTPCARRCCAVSVLISPAPTTSTRRPSRRPKIFRASATAAKLTDTAPSPSAVSVRTRLPTPNDQWNSLLEQRPGAAPLATPPGTRPSPGRESAARRRPASRARRRRGTGAAPPRRRRSANRCGSERLGAAAGGTR